MVPDRAEAVIAGEHGIIRIATPRHIVISNRVAIAEALILGVKAGLDPLRRAELHW